MSSNKAEMRALSKARHPNTFPLEFQELSKLALSTPTAFPITIPCSSHAAAMTFRTRFYEFRRALRLFSAASPHDTNLQHLLAGAESISSPRIDKSIKPVAILQLTESSGAYAEGLPALRAIIEKAKASQSIESILDESEAHPEPAPLEYFTIEVKGVTFSIPSSDISDRYSTPDEITTQVKLLAYGMGDKSMLRHPLSSYAVSPNEVPVFRDGASVSKPLPTSQPSVLEQQASSTARQHLRQSGILKPAEPTGYTDPDLLDIEQ